VNFSAAAFAFFIGVAVLWQKKDSAIHQLFFLVAFNTGFWSFSSTMADVSRDYDVALFWARMAIIGPFFLSAAFLIFSYYFPARTGHISVAKAFAILLPSIIALLLVATPYNIESITLRDWGTDFTPGPLYTALFVQLLLYFSLAARHFVSTYKKTQDPIVKKQIIFLCLGMILVVVSGVFTNLVLPLVFHYTKSSVIGPAATAFFVVLTMYAILRHGLLNLKVIAAELFSGALVFISFTDIFQAQSVDQFAYHGLLFLVTLVVALLLVKSVSSEVRRREELHVLTLKLEEANEHLKEMDQLKSEFISIASHQLRTPISVIKGYISLMLEGAYGKVDGPLREKLQSMSLMNERLVQMINNMLNVTRIEKNKIDYVCATTELAPIMERAVTEMSFKASQKGLALAFDAAGSEGLEAYVDGEKLQEVLTNLVDNAIKYSPKGTITLRAKRMAKAKGAMITVEDQGLGMSAETAANVFQKFYRAKDVAVARETGTGLGLYIVAIFVRNMGGDVWIERSAPGEGTVVAVTLPSQPKAKCLRPEA
jgi:signal transduction histidine kinase